jgi:hypothetical protein
MLLTLYSESGHCIWPGVGRKESRQNGAPHPNRLIGLTCRAGRPGRQWEFKVSLSVQELPTISTSKLSITLSNALDVSRFVSISLKQSSYADGQRIVVTLNNSLDQRSWYSFRWLRNSARLYNQKFSCSVHTRWMHSTSSFVRPVLILSSHWRLVPYEVAKVTRVHFIIGRFFIVCFKYTVMYISDFRRGLHQRVKLLDLHQAEPQLIITVSVLL